MILRYVPGPLGRFGFSIGRWAINFPLLAYWLLLVTGSIIILVQVIGDIINVIADARAHMN